MFSSNWNLYYIVLHLFQAKDNYNITLVERLIRIITLVTQSSNKVRLCTLELCLSLLKQLVAEPGKSYLQDRHLAGIENARECSAQMLRNFYKVWYVDIFVFRLLDYSILLCVSMNIEFQYIASQIHIVVIAMLCFNVEFSYGILI